MIGTLHWSDCVHLSEVAWEVAAFVFAPLVHSNSRPVSPDQGLISTISLSPEITDLPTLSSSCCFVRATGTCSSSARILLFLLPFVSVLCITFFRTPVVCFALFFFLLFFFFFFFFFIWSGLFCCVLVPGMLAFHLVYLDEFRLFGLLCFTVCDYRMCISLRG